MKTEKKERIKTRVLVLLVALSIIQIGIHWNNQTQGLPFNFISSIFSGNGKTLSLDVETLKEKYFKPEAVIVSIGTNHWRLDERDTQYHRVWKDIRDNYLSVMIRQKAEKILPKEEWLKIIRSRCVRIDFLVNWPGGIVHWFGNTKPGDSKSFEGIQSIVIVPDDNVNQTINTVYVYDEKQVYQYQVDLKNEFLPKSYYSKLADELTNKNKPRQSLLSSYPNFVSEKDIFVPKPGDQGYDHSLIEVSIPEPWLQKSNVNHRDICVCLHPHCRNPLLLKQFLCLTGHHQRKHLHI
jgi:regulatory protein YycH of two-component signal transduction system YycFG